MVVRWREKRTMGILISGMLIALLAAFQAGVVSRPPRGSAIYIGYSTACPHCHHLLAYVEKYEKNVTFLATTNGNFIQECLKRINVSWDFGVPITFAKAGDEVVVIKGYPSEPQDKDGYFLGKEMEMEFCESVEGKLIYENGNYLFCELKDDKILGNRYAIDYLVEFCEMKNCERFC